MATFTEHYDLIKPGTDDYYDVADFNENMDAIDTQLYQAEQDMAGVSEKIGNPGDEGEDTLFGLLNPGNQPEEKTDFYRYSKTEIKQQITNWAVIPSGGNSTWIYLKLLHMHAEKSGTIYVKLKATQKAMMRLAIVDKPPLAILTAPDKTNFGMSTPAGLTMEYAMFYWEYVNSAQAVKETEHEWIFPVTAGYDYVFMLTGANVTQLTVDEFLLGYTDTLEA